MEMMNLLHNRRSVRKYTGEAVTDEQIQMILKAGLLSPTSHNSKPWHFIVVRDREMLRYLSDCRVGSAKMLENAACAIAVLGDQDKTVCWTEDCSVALTQMHLMTEALGLGSCWIQCRLREAPDGRPTEEYVREKLAFPANIRLEAILSIGVPDQHPAPHTDDELLMERIHNEKF